MLTEQVELGADWSRRVARRVDSLAGARQPLAFPRPSSSLKLLACENGLGPSTADVASDNGGLGDALLPRPLLSVLDAAPASDTASSSSCGLDSLPLNRARSGERCLGVVLSLVLVPGIPAAADGQASPPTGLSSPTPNGYRKPGPALNRHLLCAGGSPALISRRPVRSGVSGEESNVTSILMVGGHCPPPAVATHGHHTVASAVAPALSPAATFGRLPPL